jgi:hypothetical protein
MHPDSAQNSPEVALGSQDQFPMDAVSVSSEMPCLVLTPKGWVEVEVRVEVKILRPLQVAKPTVCSLSSCESEVLTSITLHSINGTTYLSEKNYWLAQVVLDYTIQRRTSEQVKADQAKAKMDAAATESAAITHNQSQLNQVATLKDALQVEDDA